MFSREWRPLERPAIRLEARPDELRLARARRALSEFGTLWRNPAVPDRLREEAIREIFERFDVDGPEIVAAHPQPNENAWLLGLVAVRQERLRTQRVMELVGARGQTDDLRVTVRGGSSRDATTVAAIGAAGSRYG